MDLPSKISWQSLEYEHTKKSVDWFWALGIVAVAGTIASFIYENYFFGIFIILSAVVLAYFATRAPQIVEYEINAKGIKIKDIMYPYITIKSFWVDYNTDGSQLIINSNRTLMPHIHIPISNEISPEDVRDYLSEFIPEEEMHESASHRVMEYFGF